MERLWFRVYGTPPNSLKNSNVSFKMKTIKGVGVCFFARNTWGKRGVLELQDGD